MSTEKRMELVDFKFKAGENIKLKNVPAYCLGIIDLLLYSRAINTLRRDFEIKKIEKDFLKYGISLAEARNDYNIGRCWCEKYSSLSYEERKKLKPLTEKSEDLSIRLLKIDVLPEKYFLSKEDEEKSEIDEILSIAKLYVTAIDNRKDLEIGDFCDVYDAKNESEFRDSLKEYMSRWDTEKTDVFRKYKNYPNKRSISACWNSLQERTKSIRGSYISYEKISEKDFKPFLSRSVFKMDEKKESTC